MKERIDQRRKEGSKKERRMKEGIDQRRKEGSKKERRIKEGIDQRRKNNIINIHHVYETHKN